MAMTLLRFSAIVGVGGSLLMVAVPAFVRNLSASKSSEALEGLSRISNAAIANADAQPIEFAFPPSAPLTPPEVPRGVRVKDAPEVWDHLTWRALGFRLEHEHAFAFRFDSSYERVEDAARFSARAHADLDGDGTISTFEVRGERKGAEPARVMAGILIDKELE